MRKGDMLICTEISRLGRNMLMIMSILNLCADKGISIHSIKDNFDLSENINSKIIAFAFALAAEIERTLISQRTKEALAVKKLKGIRLGRPPGSSQKMLTVCRDMDKITAMQKLFLLLQCGVILNDRLSVPPVTYQKTVPSGRDGEL